MRTCVSSQQLGLCEDMPVGQQPHCSYMVGDRVVNGSCHCGLPQQVEPACTTIALISRSQTPHLSSCLIQAHGPIDPISISDDIEIISSQSQHNLVSMQNAGLLGLSSRVGLIECLTETDTGSPLCRLHSKPPWE